VFFPPGRFLVLISIKCCARRLEGLGKWKWEAIIESVQRVRCQAPCVVEHCATNRSEARILQSENLLTDIPLSSFRIFLRIPEVVVIYIEALKKYANI
jgi:hypothetical protein